jgi:hypothetical protein
MLLRQRLLLDRPNLSTAVTDDVGIGHGRPNRADQMAGPW